MKKLGLFFALMAIILLNTSCSNKQDKKFVFDGMVQGTYYHIIVYAQSDEGLQKSFDSIFTLVDNSVSLWVENSLINQVNRNENPKLNQVFIENFNAAKRLYTLTEGALDVTIGALVREYGFTTKQKTTLSQAQIDSMMRYVGLNKVGLQGDRIVKQYNETFLDFNAIAQGYTTDKIAEELNKRNIKSYLVDVGGEVYAKGEKPNGEKWSVAIETPAQTKDAERSYDVAILLKDESIVTSGSYRKFYEENGVKYSHTIDPTTGKPIKHSLLSASVVANDATTADGLATMCMVLGLEKSKEFLEKHKEYSAYLIYSDDKGAMQVWYSDNFEKYIRK